MGNSEANLTVTATMLALYQKHGTNRCRKCGQPFVRGDKIHRRNRRKQTKYHDRCWVSLQH